MIRVSEHSNPENRVRQSDKTKKEKGKEYGDSKRRARESHIDVGDHVVVKNLVKRNKLETNFNPQPHVVVKKNGTRITLKNLLTGVEFDRHVNHAKLLISSNPVNTRSGSPDDVLDSCEENRPCEVDNGIVGRDETRMQRRKRKPEYLNDYEIYKLSKQEMN